MFRIMIETDTPLPSTKRGRKPTGERAMTAAERKRRSREQIRAAGAKEFVLRLEGLHLEYVEKLAQAYQISTSAALKLITEAALDLFVGVIRRSERMRENGVSDEVSSKFVSDHLFPALPPIDPKELASANN
jgi:hypothetical protein